jgi:hypothetical protein
MHHLMQLHLLLLSQELLLQILLLIGSTTNAGAAKFTGSSGVTATIINIIGANNAAEVSTATFERALTGTTVI